MRTQCNKFDTDPESCRFYAFPPKGDRVKVHVDGKPDFKKVQEAFKDNGVDLTVAEIQAAYKGE